MYNEIAYTGSGLPSNTLCLTYDDGPGIYTVEIAQFLFRQGIQATFFVVGKYATSHPEILKTLKELGHLVGNHTYDHPDVTYYQSINGDIQHQILKTDAIIKNYIDDEIYFRPPYGKWSKEVANELNENVIASLNHIGPIYWDVGGTDCYYWQQGFSLKDAVEKYVIDINKIKKGIVLLHDDIADMEVVKYQNKTLELTKLLIPILKEQGYKFVRLDEIESIKNAPEKKEYFKIQNAKGKYFHINGTEISLSKLFSITDKNLQFEIIDLRKGKVAVKAANGSYLTYNEKDGVVTADNSVINDNSAFDLIPITTDRCMFRCSNGNFFTTDQSKLFAAEKYMKGAEIFNISYINMPDKKKQGVKTKLILLKKRLLYIKSKIFQG